MSVRLMGAVFELDILASEKLVLLAMADHARDDGTGCYPSIELVARKTSQSRRGVQKIMRRLEQGGLIIPSEISQGRRSTEYRITLANREQGSLFAPAQPRTAMHPTANGDAPNRERRCAQPRTGFALTVRNHKEPSGNRQSAPAAQDKPRPSPFAFAGLHLKVSTSQDELLAEAFPWADRQSEYRKSDCWLEANPRRRPKRTASFLHNWFNRIPQPNPNGGISADKRTAENLRSLGLI